MKRIFEKISYYYLIFCAYALIGWLYEVLWMWFVVPPKHFINRGVLLGPFLPIYGFGMLFLLLLLNNFKKKKHFIKNPWYLSISVSTIVTFIYTTIIEYTTPKIYLVSDYLNKYGINLLIINIITIIFIYILSKKTRLKNLDTTIILIFLLIWLITTGIEYVSHYMIDNFFHTLLWDYSKDFLNINKRVNWDASRNFAIGGTFLLYSIQPILDRILKKIKDKPLFILSFFIGILMIFDFIFHVILKII